MLGGETINRERNHVAGYTLETELVRADEAHVVLLMGNHRIEIPLRPEVLLTTVVTDGRVYNHPTGLWSTRNPDKVHLEAIEVRPRMGEFMFHIFGDIPHDEFCDCGLH